MDERERRIGLNEALFREINERLRSVNAAFGALTERMELVCECLDPACAERITMSIPEYEGLRSNPRRFVVVPGHGDPSEVEEVVLEGRGWEVIEKRPGSPAKLAEQLDPRS